jgi:hypothetical protein
LSILCADNFKSFLERIEFKGEFIFYVFLVAEGMERMVDFIVSAIGAFLLKFLEHVVLLEDLDLVFGVFKVKTGFVEVRGVLKFDFIVFLKVFYVSFVFESEIEVFTCTELNLIKNSEFG